MQVGSSRPQAAHTLGLQSPSMRAARVWGSGVRETNLLCKLFPKGSETQYQEPHLGASVCPGGAGPGCLLYLSTPCPAHSPRTPLPTFPWGPHLEIQTKGRSPLFRLDMSVVGRQRDGPDHSLRSMDTTEPESIPKSPAGHTQDFQQA